MSLFKKKENEFSTGKKRPKLKPIGGAQEKAGTSGKGGGQPAEPTYDVNSKGWSKQLASFKEKGGRNNDGAFGYGYVDENTGIEVPWYIDMINGGGANAAGDTFVSPFAELPLGGGMLSMPSKLANAANIAPYGSNQPRHFMPMEAARVDAEGKPVRVDLGPASTGGGVGGGSLAATPDANVPPVNPYAVGGGFSETAPAAVVTTAASEDAYNTPRMYRSMDRQVGLFNQGQNSVSPMLPVGADDGRAELARLNRNRQQAVGNRPVPQDDMPAILSFGGGERPPLPAMTPSNTDVGSRLSDPAMTTAPEAMTMFTARMNTVPEMVRGTRIEEMYRKYLLSGNTGTFGQFTGAEP